MENKLALIALNPVGGVSPSPAPPSPGSASERIEKDAAELRLVIEEDRGSGLFIYKTIDRRTGDVVQQLPREEVVRMHQTGAYPAGAIIKTKA